MNINQILQDFSLQASPQLNTWMETLYSHYPLLDYHGFPRGFHQSGGLAGQVAPDLLPVLIHTDGHYFCLRFHADGAFFEAGQWDVSCQTWQAWSSDLYAATALMIAFWHAAHPSAQQAINNSTLQAIQALCESFWPELQEKYPTLPNIHQFCQLNNSDTLLALYHAGMCQSAIAHWLLEHHTAAGKTPPSPEPCELLPDNCVWTAQQTYTPEALNLALTHWLNNCEKLSLETSTTLHWQSAAPLLAAHQQDIADDLRQHPLVRILFTKKFQKKPRETIATYWKKQANKALSDKNYHAAYVYLYRCGWELGNTDNAAQLLEQMHTLQGISPCRQKLLEYHLDSFDPQDQDDAFSEPQNSDLFDFTLSEKIDFKKRDDLPASPNLQSFRQCLQSHNFLPVGSFSTQIHHQEILLDVWQDSSQRIQSIFYALSGLEYIDFYSAYQDNTSLTVTNNFNTFHYRPEKRLIHLDETDASVLYQVFCDNVLQNLSKKISKQQFIPALQADYAADIQWQNSQTVDFGEFYDLLEEEEAEEKEEAGKYTKNTAYRILISKWCKRNTITLPENFANLAIETFAIIDTQNNTLLEKFFPDTKKLYQYIQEHYFQQPCTENSYPVEILDLDNAMRFSLTSQKQLEYIYDRSFS